MKRLINPIVFVLAILSAYSIVSAAFSPRDTYPPAAEDPVADGMFTTVKEYIKANIVQDNLAVGNLYLEQRENWEVNDITYPGITLFVNHYFYDPCYGQLDMYDLNSWKIAFKDRTVEIWVFLAGNHPDDIDWKWLDAVNIGTSNYPTGINDDGGFLVRMDDDPNTDVQWRPGDPQPGDSDFNFADYHDAFGYGGFNNSAFNTGYSTVAENRETYEFVFNINPGKPAGKLKPCEEWRRFVRWVEVCDWNPGMGGFGIIGGPGMVPKIMWQKMFIAALHPTKKKGMNPGGLPTALVIINDGNSQQKLTGLASATPSVYTGINQYGYWMTHLDFNNPADDITLDCNKSTTFDVPFNVQRYTISWLNPDNNEVQTDFTIEGDINLAHFQCISGYYGDYSIDYDVNDWTDANNFLLPPVGTPGTLDVFGHIAGGQYNWITFYQGKEIIRDPNGSPINSKLPVGTQVQATFKYNAALHERMLEADFNRDGKVTMADFRNFAENWMEKESWQSWQSGLGF